MKGVVLAAAAVVASAMPAGVGVSGFRYERALVPPAAGQACAVLDAAVFAHAGSQALDDLQVTQDEGGGRFRDVPFLIAINDTQTTEDDAAVVSNLREQHGTVDFDLNMPARPHSSVTLDLAAKNFVGTAVVSGKMTLDGPSTPLGTFAVFDLAARHLPASTTLPMQETNFPLLHVTLRLHSSGGAVMPSGGELVRGAIVPPSRQAQRLYSVVATTSEFKQVGGDTVAVISLPEHVPAERIRFVVAPEFHGSFQRDVAVTAVQDGVASAGELASGSISRVDLAPSSDEPIPVDAQRTTIDTAFAANFRAGATLRLVVHNAGQTALPLQAVEVEMRQRQVCFDATASARYSLFYGEEEGGQAADTAPMLKMVAHPLVAELGPEDLNPQYAQSEKPRGMLERQPDLLWVCLAGVLAILGSIALRRRRKRQS